MESRVEVEQQLIGQHYKLIELIKQQVNAQEDQLQQQQNQRVQLICQQKMLTDDQITSFISLKTHRLKRMFIQQMLNNKMLPTLQQLQLMLNNQFYQIDRVLLFNLIELYGDQVDLKQLTYGIQSLEEVRMFMQLVRVSEI